MSAASEELSIKRASLQSDEGAFTEQRTGPCAPPRRDVPIPYRSFYRLPFNQSGAAVMNATTWRKKVDKAFWRGSTTGGPFLPATWRERTRAVLVKLCHAHPSDCDAGFTEFMQTENIPEATQEAIMRELGIAKEVRFEEFFKFR